MNVNNQEQTLESYEKGLQKYIAGTPDIVSGDFKDNIDSFLALLNKDEYILEIGSGTGRDAKYMKEKGYKILCSDLPKSFISHLIGQGHEVVRFDALETDLGRKFQGIIATAVFLHFTEEQFVRAINNVKRHLKNGGILSLALKQGIGEEISEHKLDSPRYFKYWTSSELRSSLSQEGFEIVIVYETKDKKWIHSIVRMKD